LCTVLWIVTVKKPLNRSLPTKESTTIGTPKVYTGYSRTPTGKTQWGRSPASGKPQWGRSPASQLLMPGYLQDEISITGRAVVNLMVLSDNFANVRTIEKFKHVLEIPLQGQHT
jgi:hypothetical protein